MRSPCCPSLTLGWVCFWPELSQPFVVCDGGLGCPSWFVTSLGSYTAYSCRELVQVPNVFLAITLGSSLSLPVLGAGLRWLRFILGCPPSVASLWRGVDLVLYQVLVGLPSWCCCASRLLGHPSQVGSVLILHPGFLFSGLVERGAFHRVPSPLSSFGMWSPFGVICVFVTIDRQRRLPLEGLFFCVVASHLVVLS